MAVRAIQFSPEIALAAIMRIVRDATPNLYTVMKMLYVADKQHLELTGRLMFGDWYSSMDAGATPSGAYNLAKFVRGEGSDMGYPEARDYLRLDPETHEFELLDDVREEYLSEISVRCLDSVIADHVQNNRDHNYWYRRAHDGAWEAARERSGGEPVPITEREIADTVPNNEALIEFLEDAV